MVGALLVLEFRVVGFDLVSSTFTHFKAGLHKFFPIEIPKEEAAGAYYGPSVNTDPL